MKAIKGNQYTISTYGKDTEEWKEENAKLVGKKQELSRQIELSLAFSGGERKWATPKKIKSEKQMKKQEWGEALGAITHNSRRRRWELFRGRWFREVSEMMGVRARFQNNMGPSLMKRCRAGCWSGRGRRDHHRRFRRGRWGGRLELREEQVQLIRNQGVGEEKRGFNGAGSYGGVDFAPAPVKI